MNINSTSNVSKTTSGAEGQPAVAASPPAGSAPAGKTVTAAQLTEASAASAAAKAGATPTSADLKNSVDAINRFLKVNSEVEFSIDHASGKSVIKVVDTATQKVLRQFPSEQALEIGKNLSSTNSGLIDEQA